MNFIKLLESLSDKELLNEKGSRRKSFNQIKNIGKDVALASIPFAMAATSNSTKAATNNMAAAAFQADPIAVLNFALTLEYLERDFYQKGLDSQVIDSNDENVFMQISKHEKAHVNFLVQGITDNGGTPIDEPNPDTDYDFTAGGAVPDPFAPGNYEIFLALAQGFEDTGVRAYKGQAGALAGSDSLLDYALQIHSVEARHASQIRRMRGAKGWITQNNYMGIPTALGDPIYAGEENTEQGGVQLSGVFGDDLGGDDALTEAFDEPLTMEKVLTIADNFLVS